MQMHRYSPIVLFYKKYKLSTETYIAAIFHKHIFNRMATMRVNKLASGGSDDAEEVALEV